MTFKVSIHFDNAENIDDPVLCISYPGAAMDMGANHFAPTAEDQFGLIYAIEVGRPQFEFWFVEANLLSDPGDHDALTWTFRATGQADGQLFPNELWCKAEKPFVYEVEPKQPEPQPASDFLSALSFEEGLYVPDTGGLAGLGAHLLEDGRILFGFYNPNAARVYLMGNFNDWQRPGHDQEDPDQFIEMNLYRGYFDYPNIWLVVTDQAVIGDRYKFLIQGATPQDNKGRYQQYVVDPYARQVSNEFDQHTSASYKNAVIVDPTTYQWNDDQWQTPDISELILYELSVYGFTEGDPDIQAQNRGKFKGITERIRQGFFDRLGVTALSLMPLAEFSGSQGPGTLGYNPSLFFITERDFGDPDDLREMVDVAHQNGLAVILDQVFNHTSNDFNPLWKMILEHPSEEKDLSKGGLYFSGSTPWGNRLATEKADVQNMLIDACKMFITEYHVDGFRFDATHTNYTDRRFRLRLIEELKAFKPDTIAIAENLPNQSDLNRDGYNGFAQWCDPFHDKIKALLREGTFDNSQHYNTDLLGDIFFFSKQIFASHTNNVVNYCESHDEHSLPHEVSFNPTLNHPAAKERKARLGLFATTVALGQPMIYMGQEFNTERPRNIVKVDWPTDLEQDGFFQWSSRLISLRRRYPGLKLSGYNPAAEGRFFWIIAPWLAGRRGSGKMVIGWRSSPNGFAHDNLVVLLNFENHDVPVDIAFGIPGRWVKLADIDTVNDVPPIGSNSVEDPTAIRTVDGNFSNFRLPASSGFIYKWEGPAE